MPDDFKIALGRRVAELRRRAGMTQAGLAEAVGVSVETVSRLERGAAITGVETLVQMARATGSEPQEILAPPRGRGEKARLVEEVLYQVRRLRVDDLRLARDLVAAVVARAGARKK